MKLVNILILLLMFCAGFFVGLWTEVWLRTPPQEQFQPAVDKKPKKVYVSVEKVQGSTSEIRHVSEYISV